MTMGGLSFDGSGFRFLFSGPGSPATGMNEGFGERMSGCTQDCWVCIFAVSLWVVASEVRYWSCVLVARMSYEVRS